MEEKTHTGASTQQQRIQAELATYQATLRRSWQGTELPLQVEEALAYIHTHLFDEELSFGCVCGQCGLRNHNTSSHFKRAVGMGMRAYIERHRLEAAKLLLQGRRAYVLHIAWAVGFTHPESFARAFKRYQGCSATQFRRHEEERLRRTVKKMRGVHDS